MGKKGRDLRTLAFTKHNRLLFAAFLLSFAGVAFNLDAAVPRLLMIHGALLREPVLLSGWKEIHLLFYAPKPQSRSIPFEELRNRPFFELALFWGLDWVRYVEEGKPLKKLRPED